MTIKRWTTCACLLLWASACDPAADGIEGVSAPTGFAVTHSDYDMAAAIALLGPDGTLEKSRFVHSGTSLDGLGSALSSDVVLPTQSGPAGVLTYLERLGTDLVTRIDIESGEVLGQISAQGEDVDGYRANPYDCVYIDDESAWITRNAPHLGVDADDREAGNDLLQLDLMGNARTSRRVSFDAMNSRATVTNPDTDATMEVIVYARPASVVKVGPSAVVGLDGISLAYDAVGPGKVALVDLESLSAEEIAIEGMSNCGAVFPVADDESRVVVNCRGSFLGDERDEAGYVILRIEDGQAEVEHVWAAAEHADEPMATYSAVSLGGTRVMGVQPGASYLDPPTTDVAYVLDVATGEIEMLAEAGGAYVLGSGAYDPAARLLLLPDATTDDDGRPAVGVRRFEWDADGEVRELQSVLADPDLPPRAVAPLR